MSAVRSAWPDHPGYRIDLVPCRGRAIVRIGDTILAESTRAVRVIETDHVERLYLPEQDVSMGLLEANDHATICPFKGQASYWSFSKGEPPVEDVFWTYLEPFAEVAGLLGMIGVYHEKVTVEVRSEWADGATSTNRFPAWGDQEDLLRLLDARPAGDGAFVAPGYHARARNVVEGGQLLGQAVVAAARTVADQRVTWASMTFARAADFDDPIRIEVDQARRGRTFSTLSTRSVQSGKLISPGLVLLDAGAPDLIRATAEMAAVPGPEDSEPHDMSVTGRDLRVVDGAYTSDPDKVGPPEIHAWIRFRDDPGELCLRQALIAQASTHWTIAAAMLPHPGVGQSQAHETLSTGPMAISISFLDDAPVDGWLLYSTAAIWSGRGLVQGDSRVWTRDGRLVASYSLQAMVRGMLVGAGGRDASTAM